MTEKELRKAVKEELKAIIIEQLKAKRAKAIEKQDVATDADYINYLSGKHYGYESAIAIVEKL